MSVNHENETRFDTVIRKLIDAETPGYWSEFTDEEAALAGAFGEDAISEEDAYRASFDTPYTW